MSNELVKITPTPEQLEVIRFSNHTQMANAIIIASSEDAQNVSDHNRELGTRIDQVKAVHAELCAPAKLIRETADKYCKPAIEDMEAARKIQRDKLVEWSAKEKARVAEEQRKIDEEARKIRQEAERKASIEREKAEAAAAIQRQRAAAAAEEERKALAEGNAAAAKKAAESRAKADAAEAKALADSYAREEAARIQAAARISAAAPVVMAAKIEGTSFRDNWIGKLKPGTNIEDAKMAIVRAICGDSPELSALILIDEKAITKLAKALKGQMRVPGFVAANEPIAAGARK